MTALACSALERRIDGAGRRPGYTATREATYALFAAAMARDRSSRPSRVPVSGTVQALA